VERAKDGDRDAFTLLAAASVDRLFAIAYRILRDVDRAQDALQSALLEAWRDMPQLRDHEKWDPWVRRLVIHACYDEARRTRAFRAAVRVISSEPAGPDTSADLADRDELDRAFRRLQPEHRAVVVLHHYAGLPLTEVAATLGIPAGTARSRLHYAIRQLRAAVESDSRVSTEERLA
jgi:RNA polymerase sigma-70 factor (ECF subfamily)